MLRAMGFAYATASMQAVTNTRENMAATTTGAVNPKNRVSESTEGEPVGTDRHKDSAVCLYSVASG